MTTLQEDTTQATAAVGRTKKVLVVDDEASIVQLLGRVLALQNYEAVTATHWAEAMDILEHDQPDLVLLDLAMPHVDGCSMFDFIRKQGYDTPVIVISAHITDEVAEHLRDLGVSALIWKPFEVSEVLAEVERAIGPAQVVHEPEAERLELLDVLSGISRESAGADVEGGPGAEDAAGAGSSETSASHDHASHHSGHHRRRRRHGARSARKRMTIYLAGLALVCVLVAGLLTFTQRFMASLDFGGIQDRVTESITKQSLENANRAAKQDQDTQ